MTTPFETSLWASIQERLRPYLPAELRQAAGEPTLQSLTRIFEHLRTLYRILHDYLPRRVAEAPPPADETRFAWEEGALLFTDLAGFTPLMEANAARGRSGAEALLGILSAYFAEMIELISKSGGDLLEFSGDALLAVFPPGPRGDDADRAVRAGLRMQRAMRRFERIETPQGVYSLEMRLGIHHGRFLRADVGSPRRREHVLLGGALLHAKQAESAGQTGAVCISRAAQERIGDRYRTRPNNADSVLVVDDLSDEQLGEYDLLPLRRRAGNALLFDRSIAGLLEEIGSELRRVEPLACYLPAPVLRMVIESAAQRRLAPNFPIPTVLFFNLLGLPELLDRAQPGEDAHIVARFSQAVTAAHEIVDSFGGVLKKVTYHLTGSEMMIFFGAPELHSDDPLRAARAAAALRQMAQGLEPLVIAGKPTPVVCQIGLARGPVFAAEVGEPHGRREFNIMGDPVNTAARLMTRAAANQILCTGGIFREINPPFAGELLGVEPLKGKSKATAIYALAG